ncbi:MAG: SDR family NAD(P)-dependent oxidoreductase [Desmonostoc vinosum HA7617-LM4]|jgi:NAD(P)-dependent dehydrogenase (short-subunit alcohol dehydrogenase family)|nr:SDR family NAD(P)-dependent oxidoreductase [Desmonostoc vinosum HA7617-LM4]
MTKLILITGVSRGLGYAIAEQFIHEGHTVIGCARSEATIEKLRHKFGLPHNFSNVDVADEQQVKTWSEVLLKEYQPPDLLINNAAILNNLAPLWEIPTQEISQLIDVNIKGVIHLIHYFVPAMVANKKGIIINFSSGWGRSTSPMVASYCASKWAIEGLTRALAQELPDGMAAIPLNPGIIHTDMLEICFGEDAAAYTKISDWVKKAVPFILRLKPTDNGVPLTVPN